MWAPNDNKYSSPRPPNAPLVPIKCCLLGKLSARDFPSIAISSHFPSPFLAALCNMRQHLLESVVTAASDVHEKWFFVLCTGKCLPLLRFPLLPLLEVSAKRKTENSSFCYKLKCCQHLHATCGIFGQKFMLKFIIYIHIYIFFLLQRIFQFQLSRPEGNKESKEKICQR